jgi:predicted DNA-binding transcriptional regulator AlpA
VASETKEAANNMQVLSFPEAAARSGIVKRTLERLIVAGDGPPVVQLTGRRVGILESDLEAWINSRRRLPPVKEVDAA